MPLALNIVDYKVDFRILSDGSDNADSENCREKLILESSRLAVLENGLEGVDSIAGGSA